MSRDCSQPRQDGGRDKSMRVFFAHSILHLQVAAHVTSAANPVTCRAIVLRKPASSLRVRLWRFILSIVSFHSILATLADFNVAKLLI
jgi:hypothetical protein